MNFAVPSIDLAGGKAVRLLQGRRETAEILGEPAELAEKYACAGFPFLHVVDLDAAFGGKSQIAMLGTLFKSCAGSRMKIQWAGGIRSLALAEQALSCGAERVVFGTAIFEAPQEVASASARFGAERIWASLDFSGDPPCAKMRGWTKGAQAGVDEAIAAASSCGVGGVLVSSIDADGMMKGPVLRLARAVGAKWKKPFWLAGGMRNASDANEAFAAGAQGAIFGRALYQGVDLEELACLQKE